MIIVNQIVRYRHNLANYKEIATNLTIFAFGSEQNISTVLSECSLLSPQVYIITCVPQDQKQILQLM